MGDVFAPWHVIIVVLLFVLLFGARKLPEAAKSLGQALRIFRTEVKGLHDETPPVPPAVGSAAPPVPVVTAAPAAPAQPAVGAETTADPAAPR
jgi:sec-independent protein translocase protein TatA